MKIHTCIKCFGKLETVNASLLWCPNKSCDRHGLVTVISDIAEVKDDSKRPDRKTT